MKKKLLAMVMSMILVLSMSACGSGAGNSTGGKDTVAGKQSAAATTGTQDTAVSTDAVDMESMKESITEASGSGADRGDTVKVGLLAASSGGTSVLDGYIANAVMMAVDEINGAGGINGKQIEVVREDYASDPATAAEKAEKLIVNDKVVCILGVVLSSCRQAVLPVVEKYDNLLIYPIYH